jgi:hypothetical protein
MIASRLRILLVTLWVGSLWTIGYIVAPILFRTLPDRSLAGLVAGSLFRVEAWLALACAGMLLLLHYAYPHVQDARRRRIWVALIVAMLACTLIGYFGLQPSMAALREAAGAAGMMDAESRTRFAVLHGIAAGFYLLQSLLGIGLVLRARD